MTQLRIMRMTLPKASDQDAGFNLIELCIVLALTCALGSVGIPGLLHWHQSVLLDAAQKRLTEALHDAQQVALLKAQPIRLIAKHGWSNGSQCLDEQGSAIQSCTIAPLSPMLRLDWNSSLNETKTLTFYPDGSTHHQLGHFTLCLANTDHPAAWKTTIITTGRLRSERLAGKQAEALCQPLQSH